jgi:hypothetical protein
MSDHFPFGRLGLVPPRSRFSGSFRFRFSPSFGSRSVAAGLVFLLVLRLLVFYFSVFFVQTYYLLPYIPNAAY